jgi:hypothetical protein
MEGWALSTWVRESNYGYYIMLNGHAIGMALVVGVVLMLDLRVLGFASELPLSLFDRLLTVGWVGFALNFASGFVLFAAQGPRYLANLPFLIKIVLIVLGGFAMWALGRMLRTSEPKLALPSSGRTFAAFSILFWVGAIAAGRLIAYTLAPPPPPAFL